MSADLIQYSVIVPLYNKAGGIDRAIDSILNQVYQPAEIIVVDDGSTDGSADKVAVWTDRRIRLIRQSNAGVSAARNCGILESKYPYLAFLDADDAWSPGHLFSLKSLISDFPHAGAFATSYFIKEAGREIRAPKFEHVPGCAQGGIIQSYFRCIAFGNNPVWSSAVCVPRATFEAVGLFPEGVRLYEDLHMWSRIALEYPIAFVNNPSATYFKDAENRACITVVPTVHDLEFAAVLISAVEQGKVAENNVDPVYEFINRYALLNAFKSIVAGYPKEGRSILGAVHAMRYSTKLRKAHLLFMSVLPTWMNSAIWRTGVYIKSFGAGLIRVHPPRGE